MKKYISMMMIALAAVFSFSACSVETDEEAGGTNIEKMAGRWEVVVDAVDADGNVLYEDPYNMGTIEIMTYNMADNGTSKMWLNDQGNFWAVQMPVDIDYAARTFSASNVDYDLDGTGQATVTDGKILEGAAKNLHGMPNDSIVFNITFTDDSNNLTYRVSGQRYTGFYE